MSLLTNIELDKIFRDATARTSFQLIADLLAHICEGCLAGIGKGFGDAQRGRKTSHVMPSIAQLFDHHSILHNDPINLSVARNANVG